MSPTDVATPAPVEDAPVIEDGTGLDDVPISPPVDVPENIPLWDKDGFVDLTDPARYPFYQPEWGNGFYITESYDFSPLIAAAVGLLALFVAGWFVWTNFRKNVAAVEALGENAVAPEEATQKARKKEKLVTAILSGGVAASLLMTAILSMFSVLDLRGSQVESFGEWAAERYPTALVSRDQAESLLDGQTVLLQQAGNSVPASLVRGYDGGFYLVQSAGGEISSGSIGDVQTNPGGSNAPDPDSPFAPTQPDLSDQQSTVGEGEPDLPEAPPVEE